MQFGTSSNDHRGDVAIDFSDGIYIIGDTYRDLVEPHVGAHDGYLASLVPEPATLSMLAPGALAILRRKKWPRCEAEEGSPAGSHG